VQARHGRFAIDSRDEFIGARLASSGEYAEEELAVLASCFEPKSEVLIVGAHIGALAIPLSRGCRRLVAVEANPATFELLERNVLLNQRDNIEAHFGAASDTVGEIEFVCGTHNSGGSKRMPVQRREDYFYDLPAVVKVPTLRLDDLCRGRQFDLIHLDIEGSEIFALRGAQTLLPSVKYLSVEFISHHLTHVAGVTVDEWLAPIRPHFNMMCLPGSTEHNRPNIFLQPDDWHEMLQNIVDSGGGIEGLIFWRHA
jgi:FkbM family methyltransferase